MLSAVERNIPWSMNMMDIRLPVSVSFVEMFVLFLFRSILVNTVAWAPYEYGLMLACGSSDGSIFVISSTGDGRWTKKKIPDCHSVRMRNFESSLFTFLRCSQVSMHWVGHQLSFHRRVTKQAFKVHQANLSNGLFPQDVIVSFAFGSTLQEEKLSFHWKNSVFFFSLSREQDDNWVEETHLDQHSDWVRDVAWAPTFSFNKDKIASCSQVTIRTLSRINTVENLFFRMVMFMYSLAILVHH